MAVAVRAGGTSLISSTSSTTRVVTTPTIADGDHIVIECSFSGGSNNSTMNPPTGGSLVARIDRGTNTTAVIFLVPAAIASSIGSTLTLTTSNTSRCVIYAYGVSGMDFTTPIAGTASNNTNATNTIAICESVTATTDGSLLLNQISGNAPSDANTVPPSGMVELFENATGTGAGQRYLHISTKSVNTGATGTQNYTITGSSVSNQATLSVVLNAAASGVTVTPSPANATATAPNPTVVLGAVTVTPTPANATCYATDPTVAAGSGVTVSPSAANATAYATDPTVVLGAIALTPTPANATATATNPTVVLGAIALTPSPANATVSAPNPTVILGGVTVSPTAANATTYATDPTVIASDAIIPSPANATCYATDPTVVLGAVTVAPAPANATAIATDPTVILGAVTVAPTAANATCYATDPIVAGVGIIVTPSPANATCYATDPTFATVLGLAVITMRSLESQTSVRSPFGEISIRIRSR